MFRLVKERWILPIATALNPRGVNTQCSRLDCVGASNACECRCSPSVPPLRLYCECAETISVWRSHRGDDMHQKRLDVQHMTTSESIDRNALTRLLSQIVLRQRHSANSGVGRVAPKRAGPPLKSTLGSPDRRERRCSNEAIGSRAGF